MDRVLTAEFFWGLLLGKGQMPEFYEVAARGDALGALKSGAVFGALWAIGSSWSTAIRQIAVIMFPSDTMDKVIAELLAASATTLIGIAIALLAARNWAKCCLPDRKEPDLPMPALARRGGGRR